ncbi:hypothetical protein ABQE44_20475 [Mycolicibacterium sp. XJ2546]
MSTIDTRKLVTEPDFPVHSASIEQLTHRVWTVAVDSYRTLVVEGRSGLVAVNSFGTPSQTDKYRELINEVFGGKPITSVIGSIDHLDHTGRIGPFAQGAEIIGHELAQSLIYGRGAPQQRLADTVVTGDVTELEREGIQFLLRYPAPTVGTGNLAVDIPGEGVVFMVGLQSDARYGIFPDFHFGHFTTATRAILDLNRPHFIPGRSRLMDHGSASTALAYVIDFERACQRILAGGKIAHWLLDPVADALYEALAPRWSHLDGFDRLTLGIGGLRCVCHYLMGGWAIDDTPEPHRLYDHPTVRAFREHRAKVPPERNGSPNHLSGSSDG